MKKILLASSLAALSSLPAGHALAASQFSTGPAVTAIASSACTLLANDVNVNLSNGNIGSYDCNTTTASIGVAVASTTGKNNVYSLGSAGGGIGITTLSSAPTTGDTDTQATSKAASS